MKRQSTRTVGVTCLFLFLRFRPATTDGQRFLQPDSPKVGGRGRRGVHDEKKLLPSHIDAGIYLTLRNIQSNTRTRDPSITQSSIDHNVARKVMQDNRIIPTIPFLFLSNRGKANVARDLLP